MTVSDTHLLQLFDLADAAGAHLDLFEDKQPRAAEMLRLWAGSKNYKLETSESTVDHTALSARRSEFSPRLTVFVTKDHGVASHGQRQEIPVIKGDAVKPKIFVFCNSCSPGWHNFIALAEDGTGLTGHVCSTHAFAAHDMGVDADGWKHDIYAKHYPDGYEVEYVEVTSKKDADSHPGLVAAFEANRKRKDSSPCAEEAP